MVGYKLSAKLFWMLCAIHYQIILDGYCCYYSLVIPKSAVSKKINVNFHFNHFISELINHSYSFIEFIQSPPLTICHNSHVYFTIFTCECRFQRPYTSARSCTIIFQKVLIHLFLFTHLFLFSTAVLSK